MKNLAVILMLLVTAAMFSTASAQVSPRMKGCLGQCASTISDSYTVTSSDGGTWCFEITNNNLCANTGAYVVIKVNGTVVFAGDISNGAVPSFNVQPGDVVTVEGHLFDKKNGIECLILGQVEFVLGPCF